MVKKIALPTVVILIILLFGGMALAQEEDQVNCVQCHENRFPAIYEDWRDSLHAENDVTCAKCHQLKQGQPGAMEHYDGTYITPVVSPNICARCHEKEVKEFNNSLHVKAATFIKDFTAGKPEEDDVLGYKVEGPTAPIRGCEQCHGTKVELDQEGKLKPLTWPNIGVGRINPDGSKGNCSACHTRHKFSVEEARKPENCGTCHLGPDHPQEEIYFESKHGKIYQAEGDTWNWDVPAEQWGLDDFRSPTCATCHMSGLGNAKATHNVSARLSWELERPLTVRTDNWEEKRAEMQSICKECHSTTWVENFYIQADEAVQLYNERYYKPSVELYQSLIDQKLISKEKFDEPIDFLFFELWHHEGRRARMGAFMNGPDYVQWHGFYELAQAKMELENMSEEIKGMHTATTTVSKVTTNVPWVALGVGAAALLLAFWALFKK